MSTTTYRPPRVSILRTDDATARPGAETPLVRVPVADIDDTYVGVALLVSGDTPHGPATYTGGLSDVARIPAGTLLEGLCGHAFPVPHDLTVLWLGGQRLAVTGADTVVCAPPPAALDERP